MRDIIFRILRVIAVIIAAIFLGWFILPAVYRIINPGNLLGAAICVYIIFWCGFNKLYKKTKERLCARKSIKILWRIWNVCATVFVVYAVTVSAIMAYAALSPAPTGATAVVLGAQVKPWGPSVNLQQRIDAAENYLRSNPDSNAVLSGGKGNDEHISEAECMYEVMTGYGIDSDRLYKEDKSKNTQQNIENSFEIIKSEGLNESLAIVTDSFHQLRARLIVRKQGISTPIGAVNAHNGRIGIINYPTYFVREWIAIPVELLK